MSKPYFYKKPSEAVPVMGQPLTPCRNDPSRPCRVVIGGKELYRTSECLPHHCTRTPDHYPAGEIPHEMKVTASGAPEYYEWDDAHNTPICLRCESAGCDLCNPGVYTQLCPNQDETLFD
jgi:hypothetical protein